MDNNIKDMEEKEENSQDDKKEMERGSEGCAFSPTFSKIFVSFQVCSIYFG